MGVVVQGVFPPLESVLQPLAVSCSAAPPEAASWDQAQRLWWVLWSRCPGVGWVRLGQLIRHFGSLEAAWRAPTDQLALRMGWGASPRLRVDAYRRSWGADPLPRLADSGAGRRVLVPGDRRWPEGVQGLVRPPLVLHWQGRGELWSQLCRRRAVAVVGTRRPSSHGLAMAERLGAALARAGWPVVSGLAEGIDAAAHLGCLAEQGQPVAVLGTPLDRVYPRHHGELQRRVSQQGLLVSELASGAAVRAGHFASRNRLLVALAAAVVVVECPEASGALHSAEWAWSQGLPLWVVPGDAGKRSALGSNRLLAHGATPLLDPDDLIALLGDGPLGSRALSTGPMRSHLGPRKSRLLLAVGEGASLEQLTARLGQSASELAPQLLELELMGALRAEPGLQWRPCGSPGGSV
jgi:DNA processing protein